MRKLSAILFLTIIFILGIAISDIHNVYAKVFAKVNGTVKSEDGNPIEGAKVIFVFEDGTTFELTTDKKGRWRKSDLRPGQWTIGFTADGFQPKNITVNLSALKDNPSIDIKLLPIPESPLKLGDDLYKQKKYQEALEEYKRVYSEHPELHLALEKIGLCYYRLDDLEKAIEHFKEMLDREPQSRETLINLSSIYFHKGELEEGMKHFRQLDEESLTDPNTFYNIGILLFKNGQIDLAADYLTKCIALDPGYAKGYHQLALVYLNKGNIEEAKKNFQRVIELAPESEDATLARKLLEQIK